MSSKRKQAKISSSRGKSKKAKRIKEGRKHKTKNAGLQCAVCGRWFENLGQINAHYSAAGHKRKRKPPKKIKWSKEYSQNELEVVEALLELLKDPVAFREKTRAKIIESARRKGSYGF